MHKTLVRDVMSTDVPAVEPCTPFKRLVALLRGNHIRALLVVDAARRPQGVITAADLIVKETDPCGAGQPARGPACGSEHRKAIGATAADLMSAPAITVFPDARVTDAAQVMRRHRVAQLPVIEPANGQIAGLVTMSDVLDTYLRRDDDIQEEIWRDIIRGEFAAEAAGVTVSARAGIVTLNGHVRRQEVVPHLVRAVRRVEGVVGVEQRLSSWEDTRFPVPPLAW
ncbi:MAG: CBS domain-containing protein [Micromonosporaceae bacterium]